MTARVPPVTSSTIIELERLVSESADGMLTMQLAKELRRLKVEGV